MSAEQLEQTRAKIVALTGELAEVRRMPLPLDAALRRAKELVAAAALPWLDLSTFMRDDAGAPSVNLSWAMAENPSGTLLALAGAEIGRQVEAQLKAAYGAGLRTLPAAERQKRVTDLEAAISDAEVLEERLVRRLEAAGAEPDRRTDARPEIVLANLED